MIRNAVRQVRAYSTAPPQHAIIQHPYFVRRNTRGSLPVYTDIRNSNKYFTLIRNVEGDVDALVRDLTATFHDAPEPQMDSVSAHHPVASRHKRHVVLSGGNWKHDVVRWLQDKGF
ncbi:mitochondrial large subunit ribosomal protein-domain-containing protein [Cristinia sonorae]|uniref:Large ribosomal subunit protein mL49 n=1 Tax=Cristinia sonorae TaxID=1940300 RepID=A0A8K0XUE7_9AGAR|nr:mitochondrial large subunit ribosomal protein-domain-containing protein [Cristinia sonorae]